MTPETAIPPLAGEGIGSSRQQAGDPSEYMSHSNSATPETRCEVSWCTSDPCEWVPDDAGDYVRWHERTWPSGVYLSRRSWRGGGTTRPAPLGVVTWPDCAPDGEPDPVVVQQLAADLAQAGKYSVPRSRGRRGGRNAGRIYGASVKRADGGR